MSMQSRSSQSHLTSVAHLDAVKAKSPWKTSCKTSCSPSSCSCYSCSHAAPPPLPAAVHADQQYLLTVCATVAVESMAHIAVHIFWVDISDILLLEEENVLPSSDLDQIQGLATLDSQRVEQIAGFYKQQLPAYQEGNQQHIIYAWVHPCVIMWRVNPIAGQIPDGELSPCSIIEAFYIYWQKFPDQYVNRNKETIPHPDSSNKISQLLLQ